MAKGGGGKTLLREIIARLGYEFDDTNLKRHLKGSNDAIKSATALGAAFAKVTKAGLDNAMKAQKIETEKANTAIKRQKVYTQDLKRAIENVKLQKHTLQLEKMRKAQTRAGKASRTMADQLTRNAAQITTAIASYKIPEAALGITNLVQQTTFRLRALMGEAQYKRLKKNIEEVKNASKGRLSTQDVKEAADEYFTLDRNVARTAKTLAYSQKASLIYGRSFDDISKAIGMFVKEGTNLDELVNIGILSPDYANRLKKNTNLTKKEFKTQRIQLIQQQMVFTEEQKRLAHEADKALPASVKRAKTFFSDIGNEIGTRWAKAVNVAVNLFTRIKRAIDSSTDKKTIYNLLSLGAGLTLVAAGGAVLFKVLNLLGVTWFFKKGLLLFKSAGVLFAGMKLSVTGLAFAIKGVLVKSFVALAAVIGWPLTIIMAIAAALFGLWQLIKDTKIGKALEDLFTGGLDDVAKNFDNLKTAWNDTIDSIKDKWNSALKTLNEYWQNSAIKKAYDGLKGVFGAIIPGFSGGEENTPKKLVSQTSGTSGQALRQGQSYHKTVNLNIGGTSVSVESTGDNWTIAAKVKAAVKEEMGDQVEGLMIEALQD